MWWAVIASTRSRGQGAHGWHEAAQSHPQAVISLVGYHTRAGKQSLQTKNNALSREYQYQSTTVCQACHPGHRSWNALLRCLQVLRWSAFGFFLQGCTLRCEQKHRVGHPIGLRVSRNCCFHGEADNFHYNKHYAVL